MRKAATLALGLAVLAAALIATPAFAADYTLKTVVITRNAIQTEQLWSWAAEEIQKRSNGRVKLEIVSLPELGLS